MVDYVISDILKIKHNEDPTDIKIGNIVRRLGSNQKLDDCDIGVVTKADCWIIYVMRSDGSCCDEECIDWYKVGHVTWFDLCMTDIKMYWRNTNERILN